MDFSLLGFRGVQELINLHPMFVHFPIVLFPISLLLFVIGLISKKEGFLSSGRLILLLATAAALVAVISGRIAADSIPHDQALHHIMQTHEKLGYIILGLGVLFSLLSLIRTNKLPFFAVFLLGLTILCVAVFLNADLGGRMVFVHGAGVKTINAPSEHSHQHQHEEEE